MQFHKVFCSILEGNDIRATTVRTRKKFSTETTTLKSRVCPSPHRVERLKKNPKMLHLKGFSNMYYHNEEFLFRATFKTTFKVFLVSLTCKKSQKKCQLCIKVKVHIKFIRCNSNQECLASTYMVLSLPLIRAVLL